MQRFKSLFLCLPMLLLIVRVEAQTGAPLVIKGFVADERHQLLPYATVTLKHQNDSTVYKAARCDEQGAFVLTPVLPGNYNLSVSMMGFETLQQKLFY